MSNILLKHLLLKHAGQVGYTALGAAVQARQEKIAAAPATTALKRKRKEACTPCAARGLVYSVQKRYLG